MPSKLSLMVEFAFLTSRSAYLPSYNKGSVLIKIATLSVCIVFFYVGPVDKAIFSVMVKKE